MKKVICFILSLCFLFLMGCEGNDFKIQQETEHFIFFSYDQDKECLENIAKNLEDNYDRITEDLGYKSTEKIKVHIYPDQDSFHQAIGRPDAPDWVVGTADQERVIMVSPLNPGSTHNYNGMLKVAIHEFTHVITTRINPSFPNRDPFLTEGIAMYEARQMDANYATLVDRLVNTDKVPSLEELRFNLYNYNSGYALACTFVEYMVDTYGREVIGQIIENPGKTEEILGVSQQELEQGWREYLSDNYGRKAK